MGLLNDEWCNRFGGKYNKQVGRCIPGGPAYHVSQAYVIGYIIGVMLLTTAFLRMLVIFNDPDIVLFGTLEWHHYYLGVFILVITAVISLLWNKSPDTDFVISTFYGIAFGLIADEFFYIMEVATIGFANYWSITYLIGGIIIFIILIVVAKGTSQKGGIAGKFRRMKK